MITDLAGVRPLADTRDTVFGFESSVDGGRAAGDDARDLDEIVFGLQRGADAEVGQAHLDAIFLRITRR